MRYKEFLERMYPGKNRVVHVTVWTLGLELFPQWIYTFFFHGTVFSFALLTISLGKEGANNRGNGSDV